MIWHDDERDTAPLAQAALLGPPVAALLAGIRRLVVRLDAARTPQGTYDDLGDAATLLGRALARLSASEAYVGRHRDDSPESARRDELRHESEVLHGFRPYLPEHAGGVR